MVRIAHSPTDEKKQQVLALAGFGMTHDQIAKFMTISDETLRKYYRWTERIDISNEDGSLKPEPIQVAVIAALNKIHER